MRPTVIECPRCGCEQHLQRVGYFGDSAYYELHREYLELEAEYRRVAGRLERDLQDAKERIDSLLFLLRHLDPFLPVEMQDAKARQAEPAVYQAIAEFKRETACL